MRRAAPGIALLLASLDAAGFGWSDLWLRPDQQAQALLDRGRAAAAAPLFADPRRRAYAEIKAERFEDAAKQLQPFTDAESLYNRGNALARAGDLPSALSAYDAALKQAGADSTLRRDAAHNRELVARHLAESPPPQPPSSTSAPGQPPPPGRSQAAAAGQGEPKQGESKPGDSKQGESSQPPSPQSKPPSGSTQDAKSAGQRSSADQAQQGGQPDAQPPAPSAQGLPPSAGPNGQTAKNQGEPLHTASPAERAAEPPAAAGQADEAKEAAAAQRDALGTSSGPRQPSGNASPAGVASQRPPGSEQSMALDQWLRWIPDDPAGLLRRKFIIEHMIRQREAQR